MTLHDDFTLSAQYEAVQARVEKLLLLLLAVTMISSPFVVFEPAPYEGFVFLLTCGLLLTRPTLDRALIPLIGILAIWSIAGAFAVIPVAYDGRAVTYIAVSVYLAITSVIFACLLAENTERRLAVLSRYYVVGAFIASILGIVGYFNLVPGASDLFVVNGRAVAAFKDPNVYGPYLIFPILVLVQDFIYRGFRLRTLVLLLVILLALLLCFSRGAWGHFIASVALLLVLTFWTHRNPAFRGRLIRMSVLGTGAIAVLLALVLSFSEIGAMFSERAHLVNYYDAGEQGRFGNQAAGLRAILDFPNGLGPKQFMVKFGLDPHNVYLASLYAYGWIGGIAYVAMVIVTLMIGFKGLRIQAPWQPALIAAYATFLGVVAEGFIIDTDHWRHYFLLLGMVWGLSIASMRGLRESDRRWRAARSADAIPG